MLGVDVFYAFEAFETVACAGEEGGCFEEVGETAAADGWGLETVMVGEEERNGGDG